MLYKIVHGLAAIPVEQYLIPSNRTHLSAPKLIQQSVDINNSLQEFLLSKNYYRMESPTSYIS